MTTRKVRLSLDTRFCSYCSEIPSEGLFFPSQEQCLEAKDQQTNPFISLEILAMHFSLFLSYWALGPGFHHQSAFAYPSRQLSLVVPLCLLTVSGRLDPHSDLY